MLSIVLFDNPIPDSNEGYRRAIEQAGDASGARGTDRLRDGGGGRLAPTFH